MKLNTILLKFLVVLSVYISATCGATDVHSLAKSVDDHYNHLRTLQAGFTETYRGAGMDRTESGVLWLKKPSKMRWEYRSPKEKLFLSDGQNAWFYVPGEREVRRSPIKALDDLRSPLAFLLGKTKLEKQLQHLTLAPDVPPLAQGNLVLRGVPKALADRVNQVLLEVSPDGGIERIVIEEVSGSTTEYRFTNQKENLKVTNQRFSFLIPAGVEVIDGDPGQ